MFSQEEIDAVLRDAQSAVDELSNDVQGLSSPAATATAQPPATAPRSSAASSQPVARRTEKRIQRILKLRVPVRVRVAQRPMRLNDILKIMPGTILEFERDVEKELDLMVNNHQIGSGVAVKVNERFGIRITAIRNVKARIDSLRR